jgi:hypothetical protein
VRPIALGRAQVSNASGWWAAHVSAENLQIRWAVARRFCENSPAGAELHASLIFTKVNPRVARMRTLPEGVDQRSASRHPDWTSSP